MCSPAPGTDVGSLIAARQSTFRQVSTSPFGPDDQIGMLNLAGLLETHKIINEVDAGKPIDLAVDYFVGMPNWTLAGDPPFQISMSGTPSGGLLDDPLDLGEAQNRMVGRSGDCISMYTHSGTHVDTLNHMGYGGEIWNGFTERDHLGSRHWRVAGADRHPPILARGVLIDVAGAHGVDVLPDSHGISDDELQAVLRDQGTELRPGDVVAVRTGRIRHWPDAERFIPDEPGLNRAGAEFLAQAGAMMIGADNVGLEQTPSADPQNWQVVHTFLLAEAGIPIIEILNLEELAAEGVHEFAFFGACMKIRGATGSPIRPIAVPLRAG